MSLLTRSKEGITISQFDFGNDGTKFVQYYGIQQSVTVQLLAIIAAPCFAEKIGSVI